MSLAAIPKKMLHDIMRTSWALGYLQAVEDCRAPLPCNTLELVVKAEEFARRKHDEVELSGRLTDAAQDGKEDGEPRR